MKFKRILALMLALIFVLAACSSKPAENTGTTGTESGSLKGEITVQAEEGWKGYYEAAIKKITDANPEAKITLKVARSFDHLDVIDQTNAENPDVADVFALPADRFENLVNKDVLSALPAKEMSERIGGYKNGFENGLGGLFKSGEEFLAYPWNIETLVTFVNTKNAAAEGVDLTKPIELTTVTNPAHVLLPLFDAWFGVAPNNAGEISLLAKDGDKLSSTYAGTYAELNEKQKAVFDAIYGYWKLHNDNKTALFDNEAGWGWIDAEFTTGGKGLIRLDGPWATSGDSVIAKEIAAGNVEIYPISHITVAGNPLTHWQGGWALGVNSRIEADADKLALATALIEELVNPANAVELYKSTGKILENVELSVYQNSDLSDVNKKVIERVLESFAISTPRPIFNEFGSVWDTYKNATLSWNSVNPATPEAAYNELNAAFKAMLEQFAQ